MGEVYAVGVGPGSPRYITDAVKEVILYSEIVIGYKYTLKTIERLLANKEVHERLIELSGKVQIIPGISSIQVAAANACIPLDKSKVITMHVPTSIEEKKIELQKDLLDGYSVILVPRPWPKDPSKNFMQSEIALYLKNHGFDTSQIKVHVFEFLTTEKETFFVGMLKDLEGRQFSDLSVMVFDQYKPESYVNFKRD